MVVARVKGANGEREIATDLNGIINIIYVKLGLPIPETPVVQRNQNQSAVGGKDLVGTYGLAIEVKRQEQLSVNTWWKQCVASAKALNEVPCLIYRQNKMSWRVVMLAELTLPPSSAASYSRIIVRAELTYEEFKVYFQELAGRKIYQAIQDSANA